MSGPKLSEYEIRRNLEIERRAREAALARLRDVNTLLATLRATAGETERRYASHKVRILLPALLPVDVNADRTTLERVLSQHRAAATALDAEIRGTVARIETQQMLAAAAPATTEPLVSAAEALKHRPTHRAVSKEEQAKQTREQQQRRREAIDRIVGRAASAMTVRLRGQLNELAAEVLKTASEDQATMLLDEIRLRVQRVCQELRQRHADAAEATGLLNQLAGLMGQQIDEVTAALQAVQRQTAPLTIELRQQVQAAYVSAKAEADGRYAGEVTREVLAELGYHVDSDDLCTLFLSGGKVHIQKPEWCEYWVRLKVDPTHNQISFRMMRSRSSLAHLGPREQQIHDQQMEEQWCPDHAQLMQHWAERGVAAKVAHQQPAGKFAVQIIDDDAKTSVNEQAQVRKPIQRERPAH